MKRNSRIELLRIICILGITAHHLVYHSDIMAQPLGISRLFAQFFMMFGKSGVNIFVLISGYFLIGDSQNDYKKSIQRIVKSWKQVIVYSILVGGITLLFFKDSFSAGKLLKTVFPIITGHYWFMTAFIGLMILVPFLNQFVHNLKQGDYQKLLSAFFLITIVPIKNTWCNDLLWFIMLYFTAGYIKLFDLKFLTSQRRKLFASAGSFLLMWLASVILSLLSIRFSTFTEYINYFALRQNSILMYTGSVCGFLYVIGKKPFQNERINSAAKHVLPCYLIQSNIFLSSILWSFVDSVVPKYGVLYPLIVIGIVLVLTVIFMGIDIIINGIEKKINIFLKIVTR